MRDIDCAGRGRTLRALTVLGAMVLTVAAGSAGASESGADQPRTWSFNQAKVPTAQQLGRHGSGATVAVLDTWVDHTHRDLRGRVLGHAYCVGTGGRCIADRYAPDACAHGTHVAGTIASSRYGVAPSAAILAVQVLADYPDTGCSGSAADVAAGIRYAASRDVDIINLSLGTLVPGLFQSRAVTEAVHEAARAGAVVIFAAGNSGLPLSDSYGSDALIIAATGPSGGLATYSGRGSSVPLAAPGGDSGTGGLSSCRDSTCVMSTVPGDKYGLMQGTSMAAPHVAGAAALLVGQHPRRGRADIISALKSTARPMRGVQHGRLEVAAALRRSPAASTPPPPNEASRPPRVGSTTASAARPTATTRDAPQRLLSATKARTTHSPPGTTDTSRDAPPSSAEYGEPPTASHGGPGASSPLWRSLLIGLAIAAGALVAALVTRMITHRGGFR